MAFPKRAAILTAVIAATLTSCAAPNPNAAPTFTCTPTTGTPTPCYKAEYDLQTKQNRLYTDAETIYRKYLAEDDRIYRAGGATTPTPVMLETLTGKALEENTQRYQDLRRSSTKATGGTLVIGYIRRAPEDATQDAIVALQSCIDTRTQTIHEGKKSYPGKIGLERAYFSQTSNGLKISHFTHFEGEASSCK